MPTEFLTGMQLGSTMAARAQDMRASALNMTQRLMQMDQQAQMFPLELQQLNNRNQVETLNIQAANEAMSAKHADDLILAQWHTQHPDMKDIITDPPPVTGLEAQKNVLNMQTIVGQTLSVMQKKRDILNSDPAVQALVEERKAQAQAATARASLYTQQQAIAGGTGRVAGPTVGMRDVQEADRLDQEASDLDDQGDFEQAAAKRRDASILRNIHQRNVSATSKETPAQRQGRLDIQQQVAELNKQLATAKLNLRNSPTSKEAKRKVDAIEAEKSDLISKLTPATPSESPRLQQPPALAKPAAVTSTRPGYQRDEQTNRQVINIQGKWHVLMKDSQGRLFNVPSSRVDEYSENGYEVVL